MGKNEYLDGENLEWQERLFRLRKKIQGDAPGIPGSGGRRKKPARPSPDQKRV